MPTPKGLLLVMMETALTDDDEFNAWYDHEHIPERAAVPGFLSAVRYVCRSGFPRYLAVYDLENVGVLQSPGYRAIGGENLSIWTKRVQRNTRGRWRLEGAQVFPGDAITKHLDSRCHLTVVRFLGAEEAALLEVLRRYAEVASEHGVDTNLIVTGPGRAGLSLLELGDSFVVAVRFSPLRSRGDA